MYIDEARYEFNRANRKAFWNRFLSGLQGQTAEILDFNEVSQQLELRTAVYRGKQLVPLDKIVGSVGRYRDFTGAFLPVGEDMRERWQRVAMLYLDPTSTGAPPIEVYKIGSAYFVKDGNHRVSVANQLEMTEIEAYVWEYSVAGMEEGADINIDALLIQAERQDFLEKTQLDELRPNHNIRLTAPGGYLEMLRQIASYQHAMSQIDERDVPYSEAVTLWYDMRYETIVQLIEEEGVLTLFPDRTPADFYVWTTQHQHELAERYKRRVPIQDVARQIPREHRQGVRGKLWQKGLDALKRLMTE